MNATVNGAATVLVPPVTIAELVVEAGHDPRGFGIAVAVNGEVLPRSAWPATAVSDGDRIEILVATQGG